MRNVTLLLFNLILAGCSLSVLAQTPECQNDDARYEKNYCAEELLKSADKELNEIYRQLISKQDKEGKEKLKQAQKLWISFRDADAEFVVHHYGEGGSLERLFILNHNLDFTRARIKQLQELLNQKPQ